MSIYVGVNEKIEFVDYIESTGTQWIDTGFIPNQDTRIVIDFQYTKNDRGYRLVGSESTTNKMRFGTSGGVAWLIGYGSTANQRYELADTSAILQRHTLDFNKNIATLDGTTLAKFEVETFTSYGKAYIFSINSDNIADLAPAKIYSCQFYDNGVLIRNFKPCINSNGVYCLYELVEGRCYYNKGTGDFLGGELTGEVSAFNKARNVKKIYAGIENLAKTVRKGYIGVAGTARRFFNSIKEISYYGELEDLPVATSYIGSASNSNYAIFAGGEFNGTVYDACYAYDSNLTRVTATSLSKARFNLAGVSIGDYAVFAGGTNYSAYQSGVDGYNTNLVRSTSSLQYYGRTELAGASVGGYAVFAGGSGSSTYNSSEAFNSSLTRTILSSLSQSKYRLGGTSTTNYAIFAGGSSSTSSVVALKSVDAYDATLTKTVAGELSVARSRLGSVTLGGKAMFIGGNNGSSDLKAVDIYNDDLTKNSSELTANSCNLKGANIGDYVVLTGSWNKKVYAYVYN